MKVIFCGDISASYAVRDIWKKSAQELFGNVLPFLNSSAFTVANLECAVSDKNTPIRKFGPNLSLPEGAENVLKASGITCCGLSNNHSFDFGTEGLEDTVRALEKQGIRWTGAGKNLEDARKDLVLEKEGKTVRVIAVCEHEYSYATQDHPGARPFEIYRTMHDIEKAKKQADFVAVMYHGGKEHCQYPSPRLRELCTEMVQRGADLVLCQHSHCIGCMETVGNAHIVYGQGNFYFPYQNEKSEMWSQGLAVVLEFGEKAEISLVPVITENAALRMAEKDEAEKILAEMEIRNTSLCDGTWKNSWHQFCEEHAPQYFAPLKNFANGGEKEIQHFAHYLDCEAHTDVWRELFPTWNRKMSADHIKDNIL